MSVAQDHRLDGLEPDSLLAFLALLGLLRSLEAADAVVKAIEQLHPRVMWDIHCPPLRPRLVLARSATPDEITERTERGIHALVRAYNFGGRKDLNYTRSECRTQLVDAATGAGTSSRTLVDVLAALMTDAAIKDVKSDVIDPTPLCLLFGQGHQHFLDRLSEVPAQPAPPPRGKGRKAVTLTATQCLAEALFRPWHRTDPTFSFRWDPEEDVRYALMAGDPTDSWYKTGTQHGANRLAAIGLSTLALVPEVRAGRVRPAVVGGASTVNGFSFAWPIWRDPATLAGIRALLANPHLRQPGALAHLSVDHVLAAHRVSVGKFVNFSRARPIGQTV